MTKQTEIELDQNYRMVLDHGFVGIVSKTISVKDKDGKITDVVVPDVMGNDAAIVQAARVSYGQGTTHVSQDRHLIRYLLRHEHTTPFEMVTFKFHVKCPIFVARQWIRHRASSFNEYSGRYSIMTDEFYVPDLEDIKPQSKDNKQGRKGELSQENSQGVQWVIEANNEHAYNAYESLLGKENEDFYNLYDNVDPVFTDEFKAEFDDKGNQISGGIARELARMVLPVNGYTEFYWKIDLHNLFKFLKLRMDAHAQWEIQEFARGVYSIIKDFVPLACEAFNDYVLNSTRVSKPEMELIKEVLTKSGIDIEATLKEKGVSVREIKEFLGKFDE